MALVIIPFFFRNPRFSVRSPRLAWSARKSMKEYRKLHPVCEWDGKSHTKEIHHIIPVHIAPELAADPENMFAMGSRKTHYLIGHGGRNWKTYVENLREIAEKRQILGV